MHISKCDLGEPTCRRCLFRGIRCSGPKPLRIYVHRNATNLKTQTHRNALCQALQTQTHSTVRTAHAHVHAAEGQQAQDTCDPVKPSVALGRMLRGVGMSVLKANALLASRPAQLFYATVLDTFQPRPHTGVFSADRIGGDGERFHSNVALCIRALLPLAQSPGQGTLDTSIFSVLTMYVGRSIDDPTIKELARSAYTSALGDFHLFIGSIFSRDLSCVRIDHCQLALTLCTTMALFEVLLSLSEENPPTKLTFLSL